MKDRKHRADPLSGRFASPACMAGDFEPDGVDPRQASDVARWRKAERIRLRVARQSASVAARAETDRALMRHLRCLLDAQQGGGKDLVFSGYWPIKGEPDLRPLMTDLDAAGVAVALPIVETRAASLVFRRWTPETRMVRGDWNIPVPPADADAVTPDIMLAPLMGWDGAGFRLGYGGGYFDRTLAALDPRPFTIGIGLHAARLETIFPQPHDIPLDVILTEAGVEYDARTPR